MVADGHRVHDEARKAAHAKDQPDTTDSPHPTPARIGGVVEPRRVSRWDHEEQIAAPQAALDERTSSQRQTALPGPPAQIYRLQDDSSAVESRPRRAVACAHGGTAADMDIAPSPERF